MEAGGGKHSARLDDALEEAFEAELDERMVEIDGDDIVLGVADRPTPARPRRPAPRRPARTRDPVEPAPTYEPRPDREEFPFEVEPRVGVVNLLAGVLPSHARVEVADGWFEARFGIWRIRTPLANVESAEITGPYSFAKVAGPPHLSLKDGGLTFATTTRRGVCLSFRQPVKAQPLDPFAHRGLTVTVADPQRLVEALDQP